MSESGGDRVRVSYQVELDGVVHDRGLPFVIGVVADLSGASPEGARCEVGAPCQIWGHVPPGGTISLTDNLVRGAHINYLVGGVDVQGTFEVSGNVSETPQETCWFAAATGCEGRTWGPLDFVAFNPEIEDWLSRMIYCQY